MHFSYAECSAYLLNHFHQFFVQNTIPSTGLADLSMVETNAADVANSRIYRWEILRLLDIEIFNYILFNDNKR